MYIQTSLIKHDAFKFMKITITIEYLCNQNILKITYSYLRI